ncbi:MAG: large conductance mechanosensitive channel protein MscL [Rhodocyclales bacterium]|nr:large conductance mechanosensitive channel protein MscL [Rhodocyclales bacterium]
MSIVSEFKEFAMKGNVVDLAVGVIIGGAFGKIVDSFVKDVVMPVIGRMLGGVDFKHLYLNLGDKAFETLEAAEKAGAPIVKYGAFINSVVDFVIIAFAIFMAIKVMNRLKRAEEAPPSAEPTTRECPHCLSAIPLKATRCPHCTSQLQ